jgi:signal peptidase I
MMPTLKHDSMYLYNPLARKYKRGDIVRAEANGEHVVKRIIAMGGDRVTITQSGSVGVNGEWLDEPYIARQSRNGKSIDMVIPAGHVWLMGDNRGASSDSRDFGAVPIGCVSGRVYICKNV